MALSTYVELQASVASWLARSDLTTPIVDMIRMCEAEFNRTLRCREMEQRAYATATEYMAMPTGYLEMRSIQLNETPKVALEMVAPEILDANYSSASGEPRVYCLLANQIQLGPAPDGTYTVEIDYYEVIPPLASNTTNWLLTAYPDLYLYGSLLRAGGYLRDPQLLGGFQQAYGEVMRQLVTSDRRARWSGSRLAVRPA